MSAKDNLRFEVAPRAGAWIETLNVLCAISVIVRSHPVRVRGLKLFHIQLLPRKLMSHPVRVRGLKLEPVEEPEIPHPSHPVRVRGLKLVIGGGVAIIWGSHPVRVRGLKRYHFLD